MSAASGIPASQDLLAEYAKAMEPNSDVRFLKIGISEERLVPKGSWKIEAEDLRSDLAQIAKILEDKVPAFVLARLDGTAGWLFISYVPDTAQVRDKMLYASSRSAVTKALGGQAFEATIFATSKSDLTPAAYSAHLQHMAAPHPMSAREMELANIKAAEKDSSELYEGSRARKRHVAGDIGYVWPTEIKDAIIAVASGQGSENLVILGLDTASETLMLAAKKTIEVNDLASSLPSHEPSYAFYRWQDDKIVFIYACPSASKIKIRMMYSSGKGAIVHTAQEFGGFKVFKKLETSDPSDLDMSFAKGSETPSTPRGTGPPSFARPRGPPRKR